MGSEMCIRDSPETAQEHLQSAFVKINSNITKKWQKTNAMKAKFDTKFNASPLDPFQNDAKKLINQLDKLLRSVNSTADDINTAIFYICLTLEPRASSELNTDIQPYAVDEIANVDSRIPNLIVPVWYDYARLNYQYVLTI